MPLLLAGVHGRAADELVQRRGHGDRRAPDLPPARCARPRSREVDRRTLVGVVEAGIPVTRSASASIVAVARRARRGRAGARRGGSVAARASRPSGSRVPGAHGLPPHRYLTGCRSGTPAVAGRDAGRAGRGCGRPADHVRGRRPATKASLAVQGCRYGARVFGGSPGRLLQIVAVAHAGVGAVLHRDALADVVRRGVLGSVPDRGDRATAFWFMAAAPALWLGGRLLRSAESSGDLDAQAAAGRVLIATGVVGSAAMPVSGFWALAAIGISALRGRRGGSEPAQQDHLTLGVVGHGG